MKKIRSIFVALSVSALLVGCGAPSKEDVCGDCLDANIRAQCEADYDTCAQTEGCSLGDFESAFVEANLCPTE